MILSNLLIYSSINLSIYSIICFFFYAYVYHLFTYIFLFIYSSIYLLFLSIYLFISFFRLMVVLTWRPSLTDKK